jgi:hypothetical protein
MNEAMVALQRLLMEGTLHPRLLVAAAPFSCPCLDSVLREGAVESLRRLAYSPTDPSIAPIPLLMALVGQLLIDLRSLANEAQRITKAFAEGSVVRWQDFLAVTDPVLQRWRAVARPGGCLAATVRAAARRPRLCEFHTAAAFGERTRACVSAIAAPEAWICGQVARGDAELAARVGILRAAPEYSHSRADTQLKSLRELVANHIRLQLAAMMAAATAREFDAKWAAFRSLYDHEGGMQALVQFLERGWVNDTWKGE